MNLKSSLLFIFTVFAVPTTSALAGIASTFNWTISEINVCFAEKETQYYVRGMKGDKRDWRSKEKKRVQEILENEFTVDRTGYTFVGFKDCKDTENIHVVVGVRNILSKDTLMGVKGIATTGMKRNRITSYESAYGAVLLSPFSISKTTVTHEFGHILGLMHEHNHPDSPVSVCPYYLENKKESTSLIYTEFDKKSVMNYCYVLFQGMNKGLSKHDRELILNLYNTGR